MGLVQPQGFKDITVVQAVQWMEKPGHGFNYLDIRCEEEHETMVAPKSSINVPAFTPDGDFEDENVEWIPVPTFEADVEARFGKDAKLLIGCRAGNRSTLACKRLVAAGFENLWNVESSSYMRTRQMGDDF
ncbi:hypothetical protein JKP88DRAFT_175515 [Tribonema minus]|uniref:Rhodanese domain-containing protein n=1 Tax=Tribonema minus TaxID=303371 RepID=A0A836CME5_9STRA|nr:hypothetical protein JKP88DRAFT_175515 [Tribonema minus]